MTGNDQSVQKLTCSANVRPKDIENANNFYCFLCWDYKPTSERKFGRSLTQDDDEDYNFEEDMKKQREMSEDSRKRVKVLCMSICHVSSIAQDMDFNDSSVSSMSETEILRSICIIEQTLLLSDCSPSIHSSSDSSYKQTIDQQEVGVCLLRDVQRDQRLYLMKSNPSLNTFFTDLKRSRLHKHAVNVRSYLASKDLHSTSRKHIVAYFEECPNWRT